jgi:type I restriction enzyme S subunit
MRCDRSKVLPEFVVLYFKTSEGQHKLLANTAQVGVPSIAQPVTYLRTIEIPLPPLPEQRAIAHILGTLDDKIELNRKMNETLEAMARAIFKSWFIDFDPVRAKAEGRDPGLPKEIADLFPDSFEDSELGKIPKGWRVGTLSDFCEIVMGQSPPGETYNESGEGLPFYQGIRDFGFRFPNRRVYCNAASRIIQKGDVLLSVRAPVGSLNIAVEDCAIGRGIAALRIKGQHYGFLYYLMKETQWSWKKYEDEGTVFGSATKSDVQKFSVIIPPTETILNFNNVVFPMDETIKNNEIQSRTLASIRDALLPKLLSGEIRVKEVEKIVVAGR